MDLWNAGTLLGVSRLSWVCLGSRSSLIGYINLDVKCAGARSAGNPVWSNYSCNVGVDDRQ
jgi:hypothetical protein